MNPETSRTELSLVQRELEWIEKDASNTHALIKMNQETAERIFLKEIEDIYGQLRKKLEEARENLKGSTEERQERIAEIEKNIVTTKKELKNLSTTLDTSFGAQWDLISFSVKLETEKKYIAQHKQSLKRMRDGKWLPTSQFTDLKSTIASPALNLFYFKSLDVEPSQLTLQLGSESLVVGTETTVEIQAVMGKETSWSQDPALSVSVQEISTGLAVPRELVSRQKSNSCLIKFRPRISGNHRVDVTLYNQLVKGSPLLLYVHPVASQQETQRRVWNPKDSLPASSANATASYPANELDPWAIGEPCPETGRTCSQTLTFQVQDPFENLRITAKPIDQESDTREISQSSESIHSEEATQSPSPETWEFSDETLSDVDTCDYNWNEERKAQRMGLNFDKFMTPSGKLRGQQVFMLGRLKTPMGCIQNSNNYDIVVCNQGNNKVAVYDKTLEHKWAKMIGPNPSAVVQVRTLNMIGESEDMYAIKDDEKISLISASTGKLVREIGKGFLSAPYGLALSDEGYLITVNDETKWQSSCETEIMFFSPRTGKLVKRLPFKALSDVPSVNDQVHAKQMGRHPKIRFIDALDGKIVCSDLGRQKVYVVSQTDGELLMNPFGEFGNRPGCFKFVSGISLDGKGRAIFGGGPEAKPLQLFQIGRRSSDTKFLGPVEIPNTKPRIEVISDIYVSENGLLIVSSRKSGICVGFQLDPNL